MNVLFEIQNKLKDEDAEEINRIAESVPIFLINKCPNYKRLGKLDLYNEWIQTMGIIPSNDLLSEWSLLFLIFFVKEVPQEYMKLQLNAEPDEVACST